MPERKRSKSRPTLGEVNRSIDEILHPFFHRGPLPIIADTVAHSLVEQDPRKSLEKFLEFNFGPLVRETLKLFKQRKRGQTKKSKT